MTPFSRRVCRLSLVNLAGSALHNHFAHEHITPIRAEKGKQGTMKTYTKEIEALKQIKHTPEELETFEQINTEISAIDKQIKELQKQYYKNNDHYSKTYSIFSGESLLHKMKEIRNEIIPLTEAKNELIAARNNISETVRNLKIEAEKRRIAGIDEELNQTREERKNAFENLNKKEFDKLSEKEKILNSEKEDAQKNIEEYRKYVPEMQAATEALKRKIEKETAEEVLNHLDAIQQIFEARKADLENVLSIQKDFDLSDKNVKDYSLYSILGYWKWDVLTSINKILSASENGINELHEMASYEE